MRRGQTPEGLTVVSVDHERKWRTVKLAAGDATAMISFRGAEPLSWTVSDRNLLWDGDVAFWPWHAPILFPVIGDSTDGTVRVRGSQYRMARHGFARTATFECVERTERNVRLRLTDSDATHVHYPFAFVFEVVIALGQLSLSLIFEVENRDDADMPYSVGFHPAIAWPFADDEKSAYSIEFEAEESPIVPTITSAGLLREDGRRLPFDGRILHLAREMFTRDALVFRDAASRSLRFIGSTGAVTITADNMPHWALWTNPDAPFLCVESWTGHGDIENYFGDLKDRPSIRILKRGQRARHAVTLAWQAQ